MLQSFSKLRATKSKAEIYSEINYFQQQYGRRLALLAKINEGDKVLDMGCGTGEVTSFLAEKVGKEGEVVGVEPDLERIEVAVEKYGGIHDHMTFKYSDSFGNFPHFDEQYYDIHFSNFVYQWHKAEEKAIFVNTAYKSLKPGGKIAITSYEEELGFSKELKRLLLFHDVQNVKGRVLVEFLEKKSNTETLLQKAGFVIVSSEYCEISVSFPSAEDFLTWLCVTDYYAEKEISSSLRKNVMSKFVNEDGTTTLSVPSVYQIVARKTDRVSENFAD